MSPDPFTVCIVGVGPRGLSVLERLCANERKAPSHGAIVVHLVDPCPPGSGRAWRADQSPLLLTNAAASRISVWTDHGMDIEGPVETGPSLYEWAVALAAGEPSGSRPDTDLPEARRLGPDTYPSRVLYGRYLRDALRRVVSEAPSHVQVLAHRAQAVELAEAEQAGAQTVLLANGTRLAGIDAVVLSQGRVPARAGPEEERIAREAAAAGLTHVPPASAADVDLAAIMPGEPVLLRGLGLTFFDYLPLLTVARGGRFERSADGGLVYRASGREPRLYAGSRRGVPYHARSEYEKGAHGRDQPRLLTAEHVAYLRELSAAGERPTFGDDVWPLIAGQVESVYYGGWLSAAGRGAERAAFCARYLTTPPGVARLGLLDRYEVPPRERWDWETLSRPYGRRVFRDRTQFRAWLLDYLARDVRHARAAAVSNPRKAALNVLRDLHDEIRLVADDGGLEASSYRDEVQGWYAPLNAFLFAGPPVSRIEELIALINAGVIDLVGPRTAVQVERDPVGEPCFTVVSNRVGGPPVRVRTLIEARLPEPDMRRTVDPLLSGLIATGQAGAHRIDGVDGTSYETGGLAVSKHPYRLLTADGQPHPRRFAYGIPTGAVHWATAPGARADVSSLALADSDSVARAVLELAPARPRRRSAVPGGSPDAPSPLPSAALSDIRPPHRS